MENRCLLSLIVSTEVSRAPVDCEAGLRSSTHALAQRRLSHELVLEPPSTPYTQTFLRVIPGRDHELVGGESYVGWQKDP